MSERRVHRSTSARSRGRHLLAMRPAPRRRGGLRRWVAGSAAVGLLGAGLITTVESQPAAAAEPANPWTQVRLTLLQDGTGHGGDGQTFVTTANGYVPGDDRPDDGVVSSNDTVTFGLSVQFEAAAARTVRIALDVPQYLTWPQGDTFCRDGRFVTASRVGNVCSFRVPAGIVESFDTRVTMVAGDTAGQAIPQTVRATVAVQGDATYAESSARTVTVVSAPAADVVLTARPLSWVTSGRIQVDSSAAWSTTQNARGEIVATPVPLRMAGFAPNKGVSTTGSWFGKLDVSGFPAGTVWSIGGVAQPVADGFVSLPPTSGPLAIAYQLPGGWPPMEEGEVVDFPVRVVVDPQSFATRGYLNNGRGWQPGDGLGQSASTANGTIGAQAGFPWPNNDWAAVRIRRDYPVAPPFMRKDIIGPRDASQTLWAPGNTSFGATDDSAARNDKAAGPGTELTSQIDFLSDQADAGSVQFVVGDSWDTADQYFDLDPARPVKVIAPDGSVLSPSSYVLQWSTESKTPEQISDLSMSGWISGTPSAAAAPTARSVRVVFAPDALPSGTEAGAGRYSVRVPLVLRTDFTSAADARRIVDTGTVSVLGAPSGLLQVSMDQWVNLVLPRTPEVTIPTTALSVNKDEDILPTGVAPGDVVTFQAAPTITGLPTTTDPLLAAITIELDRCLTAPVNLTAGWTMTGTVATPGPTGKVCGDPGSTPAVLTFQPIGRADVPVTWTDAFQGEGTLPKLAWTAQVAAAADLPVTVSSRITLSPEMGFSESVTATGAAQVPVTYYVRGAAAVDATDAEVGDPFYGTVIGDSALGADGGAATSSVIILPFMGDGPLFDTIDVNDYTGATASDFTGTYTVGGVTLDPESSARATIFYTTADRSVLGLGEDAAEGITWVSVPQGQPLPANATALRVVLEASPVTGGAPEVGPSMANVTIEYLPQGNAEGDVYVTWASAMPLPGVDPDTGEVVTTTRQPWPGPSHIVASNITGLVWSDYDADGTPDDDEAGYAGVTVELYATENGQRVGAPLRTTTTGPDGRYTFDATLDDGTTLNTLHSGEYIVVVHRGTVIPTSVETYYGETMPVEGTYSYNNQFRANAREESTLIRLGVDTELPRVDFGFHQPNPKIALDKSQATTTCDDQVCTVTWDVTVTNVGTDPLDDVVLYDRLGSSAVNVSAVGAQLFQAAVLAGGSQTVYAIAPGGETLYAWGSDVGGALGDGGSDADSAAPAKIELPLSAGTTIEQVVAGPAAGYALASDGTVYQWGTGAGGTVTSSLPVAVDGTAWADTRITQLAAGAQATYALAADGTVYAWGSGGAGQLGDGEYADRAEPASVDGAVWADTTITQIASRGDTAYALGADGQVYAWGADDTGQLGDGAGITVTASPVRVDPRWGAGQTIKQVAAGTHAAYAIAQDGTLWSWGRNTNGELGRSGSSSPYPGQVAGTFTSVVGGDVGAYALGTNGTVYAWGEADDGRLGSGATSDASAPSPVVADSWAGEQIVALGATSSGGYAVAADGSVYSWGAGTSGQLGTGTRAVQDAWTPHVVAQWELDSLESVMSIQSTAFAISRAGDLYSWGYNSSGQLGIGLPVQSVLSPHLVETPPWGSNVIASIASTGSTVFVADSAGTVYSWGMNNGALSNPDVTGSLDVPEPIDWAGLPHGKIVQVAAGNVAGYALDDAGAVYAWGANTDGQLGTGAASETPVRVTGGWGSDPVREIVGYYRTVLVRTESGAIWGWGQNTGDQLLQGTTTSQTSPVPVGVGAAELPNSIIQLAQASENAYALTADGDVYAWGSNTQDALGQTGAGNRTLQRVENTWAPAKATAIATAGGDGYDGATAFVLTDDGQVFAWGSNDTGRLGTGDATTYSTPTPVRIGADLWGATPITAIAAGRTAVFAITADGAGFSWGGDNFGVRGDGGPSTPVTTQLTPAPLDGPWLEPAPWISLGARMTPTSTRATADGTTVTREYTIPGPLRADVSRTVRFSATYRRGVDAQVVVNQAWVDSPTTPKVEPDPAAPPTVEELNPDGVPGNGTCITDADIPPGQIPGNEDSCDQVPALIPALESEGLARIQGQTWIEVPPLTGTRLDSAAGLDGLPDPLGTYPARLNGMIVKLFSVASDGTLTQIDETTTSLPDPIRDDRPWSAKWDPAPFTFPQLGGHYYFDDLPPGTYQVQFVIPDTLVPETWPGKDEHENCGIDDDREDCPTPVDPSPVFRAMLPAPASFAATSPTTLAGVPMAPLLTAPVMPLATVPIVPLAGAPTGTYTFTVAGAQMHADPVTGMVLPVTLAAGDVEIFDAGVYVVGPADLEVVKTPTGYAEDIDSTDPLTLQAGTQGTTDPLPISVTVTNAADEPLTAFTFTDTTLTGPAIADWSCAYTDTTRTWPADGTFAEQLLAATLATGESFVCEGTLPAMGYSAQHVNSVLVGARGQLSGRAVDQSDDFGAQVLPPPAPGLTVTKASTEGDGTLAEPLYRAAEGTTLPELTVFFIAQNTGSEALTNIAWADETTDGAAVSWLDPPCVWVEVPADGSAPVEHLLALSGGVLVEQGATAPFSLPAGELLTCTGMLAPMEANTLHADTVTVNASGAQTGGPVIDADDFATTGAAIGVVKQAFVDGQVVDPEPDVVMVASAGGLTAATPVQVTITNLGTEPLTDLVLTDVTGSGIDVEDWQCTDADIDALGSITVAGAPLVLDPGASLVCTATLPAMPASDVHSDTATIDAVGVTSGAPVTDDDPLTVASTAIDVVKVAVVGGVVVDPEPVALAAVDGQTPATPVRVIITNTGAEALTHLVFTDATTDGPDVGAWRCADGITIGAGGVLMAGTAEYVLAPDATLTCTGELPPMEPGVDHSDTVTVTGTGVDSQNDAMDDDPLVVESLGLVVDKTALVDGVATDPVQLMPTDGMTGTTPVQVTITNPGADALTDLRLTDETMSGPAVVGWKCGTAQVAADGLIALDGAPVVIQPGDSLTCTGTLPAMVAGAVHEDTVTITGVGVSTGLPVSDDDPLVVTALPPGPVPEPGLAIEKVASVTEVNGRDGNNPGDLITWEFVVTNTGNVTLTDVTVVDPVAGVVTLDVTTLAPGEVATGTAAAYTITDADLAAGIVTNTAYATGVDPDDPGVPVESLPDDTTTPVTDAQDLVPVPGLTIDKTAVPVEINGAAGVNPGDKIAWLFVVTNTGAVTLEDVTVVDPTVGPVTLGTTTLAPGDSTSGSATHTVTVADLTAGTVKNTAHATGVDPEHPEELVESSPDSTVTPVVAPVPPSGGRTPETARPPEYTGLRGPLARTGVTLTAALAALVLGSMGFTLVAAKRRIVTPRGRHLADE